MIDLSGVNLTSILDEVTSLVPQVLPVIIGFTALRKGLSFLKKALRGA